MEIETDIEKTDQTDVIVGPSGHLLTADDSITQMSRPPETTRRAYLVYLYVPVIFLTSALLGGLRFSSADGSFIFLKPSLVCLIFAAMLMVLFARAKLIQINSWFAEDRPLFANIANGVV